MPVLTKINTNVIADNAITAAKTASSAEEELGPGLTTPATADLTGTISTQQFKLADAFTLTGDLTVNDDLILGKVRDDGTGQTLTHTAATNRTLTGTGHLTMGNYIEGSQKGHDAVVKVDGMTGTLGSAVIGGSGLTALGTVTAGNLSNTAIVYPTGHIIQTKFVSSTTSASYSSTGQGEAISVSNTITMSNATNKILMLTDNNVRVGVNSPNKNNMRFGLTARMAISGGATTDIRNGPHDGSNGFYALRLSVVNQELSYYGSYYPFSYLFEPDSTSECTISVFASIYDGTDQSVVTNVQDGVGGHGRSQMTLMEIVST